MNIKEKTLRLIDELKSTCATYGMGNDGNEYKIITQVFLYKFINDKFGYEVKKAPSKIARQIANAPKWEVAYAELSDNNRKMLQFAMPPDVPMYIPTEK
jgi:type I restriction enzyme M protein